MHDVARATGTEVAAITETVEAVDRAVIDEETEVRR
jgi:hypothetical protein